MRQLAVPSGTFAEVQLDPAGCNMAELLESGAELTQVVEPGVVVRVSAQSCGTDIQAFVRHVGQMLHAAVPSGVR